MESNKPINKINSNESWTDGVWDGLMYGAAAGGASMGAIHGGMAAYGSQARSNRLANKSAKIQEKLDDMNPGAVGYDKQMNKLNRVEARAERQASFNSGKKLGGWRGVAAYGGSALVGGIAGGAIDSFNNN